jgi:hypothetical protein
MGFHMFTCAQPHARPTQKILSHYITQENHLEYHINSLQGGGQHNVPVLSQIGTTNLTQGLSQVHFLEDVSRSCNHRHSLLAREAVSTSPSLSHKYSKIVLESGLVKIYAIFSLVGRYCTCIFFLYTMSLI